MKGAPEKKLKKHLFVERILGREIILDIGGGKPWETGWIHREYRHILESKKQAYCVDITPQYRPHIVADIRKLPFKNDSIDGIICNAVLEHVKYPQESIDEMYGVLKKGGELILYAPWIYHYHGVPMDYYRFSEPAFRHLLRSFEVVEIHPCEFAGYPPNMIYCLLGMFPIPDRWYKVFIRLALKPLYAAVRCSLLLLLLRKAVFISRSFPNWRSLNTKVDAILVDNWTHGYWCWCRKGNGEVKHFKNIKGEVKNGESM